MGMQCVGGLGINEAELSINSSSLSSLKALFISLLSGLSGEGGPGCFPWQRVKLESCQAEGEAGRVTMTRKAG